MPNNPPIPQGTKIWTAPVTPAMTSWAKSILVDPKTYPMFSETHRFFGPTEAVARVEWHSWTYRNGVRITGTFRGVTLYEVIDPNLDNGGSRAEGIDVSHYQGNIDWDRVAAAGNVFTFIKVTEGVTLVDQSFAANWRGARAAGVLRGAYHFFHPTDDAVAQADHFLAQLDGQGDLPAALDVEVGAADPRLLDGILQWLDRVSAQLGRALIYVSPAFWAPLRGRGIEERADLWLANWTNAADRQALGPQVDWSFWQYTATGTVPGINGHVDLDLFQGSLDDLHVYVSRAPHPAPPTYDVGTVVGIQGALNFLGATPPLVVDGIVGPATRAAIERFQAQHGLVVDGVVGPITRYAIGAALASA
jgi:lysozyme